LTFHDDEFVVLLGPSGCGKSTTLRMIAGLESLTDGEILIDGEPVLGKKPKDRDIALVFQNYALYPHKTVRENMAYGLEMSTDLSDEEIDRRVEQTAEMMGIEPLLEKKPGSLSGGQQQRVATGRAIVREPSVFLFDEPLSNLDAKLRKHLRTELARLHSELGITSLYVTHDQEEAMTLADRVVVLEDGELQQIGTPLEIYNNPANLFVADFVGSPSMNLFDVDLERFNDGSGELSHDGWSYPVSESFLSRVETYASSYTFGIRPENIRLADSEPDDRIIEGTVDVIETMGSDNILYLDVHGEECRVRVAPTEKPSEGETVRMTFDESSILLFDRETEENVIRLPDRAVAISSESG